MSNFPLREVLMMAFGVEPYRLATPDWVKGQRIDIHATIPTGAARERVPEMLQSLLVERFRLVTHFESRPVALCELTVGKDGMKMREVEPVNELTRPFLDLSGKPLPEILSGPPENQTRTLMTGIGGFRVVTASTSYESRITGSRATQIVATRMTMQELAGLLGGSVDRPVIDKTGLTGVYQFTIELPENAAMLARVAQASGLTTNRNGEPLNADPSGGSAFKAVETLGLKLEERRSPLDVLVVDKIERNPTEN
jgi:uncharacterized protein (TIGR03435 family)